MGKQADMNGLWSGTYSYELVGDPVAFTAWFDDRSGALGGTISEPNTFLPAGPDDLQSTLTGVRDGLIVDFAKTYTQASGAHQTPIQYEGEADAELTLIKGIWRFRNPVNLSGRFTLSRVSNSLERAIARRRIVSVDP